ncbi:helix-turn-helix transcriptional regulator [Streptomyces bingchenggensis]
MPTENARAFGKRVAYHRRIARRTQQELADAAGIHVGTLRKIERGARGAGDGVVEALAAALGVDTSRLLGSRDRATRAFTPRADRSPSAVPHRRADPSLPPHPGQRARRDREPAGFRAANR